MKTLQRRSMWGLALAVLATTTSGCDSSTNLTKGTGQMVSLSFAGRAPALAGGAMAVSGALGDTLVQGFGNDTLRITSVEIVLRKIELERAGDSAACDTLPETDDCEEFKLGPQLVSVPLAAGVQTSLSVLIDSGDYENVQFKIHKPGDDALDAAFKAANPDFANVSIRVQGTFDGVPFVFTSTLDQEQEYEFHPPLHVNASGTATNLTIRLDVSTWFRNGTGALIDPATAGTGGANEGLVKENIKNSIKAFEDEDRNGDERDG